MRLTDKQIVKYQNIYFETFGKFISKEDALIQGMALLRLIKVLSGYTNDNKKEKDYGKRFTQTRCR